MGIQRPNGRVTVWVESRFSTNSGQALKEAALAGLGIIFQAAKLTLEDLDAGRLIRILPDWRSTRLMHLLFAPDRRITLKLRSFIEFAAARFG